MTYQIEFPDFLAADIPPIPAGFDDTSWHNNTCPSFTNDDLHLTIWIDYADISLREIPGPHPRFYLEHQLDGEANEVAHTDNWQEVLDAIARVARRGYKPPLTFAAFQASRTWCDDLTQFTEVTHDPDSERKAPCGNLYLGSLYIEKVQDDWPDAAKAQGGWHLLIENTEAITDDLAKLERDLFAWAVRAGYEQPEQAQ